jgi:hypothetical protein
MTDESVVPSWMKEEQQKEEALESARHASEHRALAVHLILEREGPKFWQSLKEKLQISVESLRVLNLNGSFGSPMGDPRHIHIEVVRQESLPQLANTDIYFDGESFHCTGLNIGSYDVKLVVATNNDVAASVLNEPHKMMDPDRTAEYVMRRMVNFVKTGRR